MKKETSKQPRILNIFLADDDADDCLLFKEALKESPIPTQLTTISDGDELMQLLRKSGSKLPHALFLDLNMPRKNGFACLEEIKKDTKLQQIPVIILSTSLEKHMADHLYQEGAHYYISKPSDFVQLKKVIQDSLELIMLAKGKQPPRENFLFSSLKTVLFRNEFIHQKK